MTEFIYGDVLPRLVRRWPEWVRASRGAGDQLAGTAVAVLLALIAGEMWKYDPGTGRTPMGATTAWLAVASIIALAGDAVRRALDRDRDPFRFPARLRACYVYAAEFLLLFALVHLRMTVPELFSGWLAQYWTLVVMLIGFAGMGLGEFFDRRGIPVLAEPLQRTGLILPVVPLAAYWVRPPLVPAAAFPQDLAQYAVLWLIVAALYGVAASLWRSPVLGLLSAFCLNFGLWSMLANDEIAFREHPQLWLIPPALIILIAEHLNRERLPADVASGLRFLGICAIYVSSTADHFIAGIGQSAIMPVVLAVLSVCGVLAGISLRVRAFLFFGISFLVLDVLTMIWNAAVNRGHTWVWWVSGIILGAAILALFAVFEKRRKDVLVLLDQIRKWD